MDSDVIERFDSQLESIEGTPVMEDISSVYVLKESIPDVLSLNDLSEQIKSKQEERYQKENIISGLEKDRDELAQAISDINDDNHIKEVSFKLDSLEALNNTIDEKKKDLEEIFGTLRTLEDNYKALDEKTRSMVEKMTIDYNAKAKEFSERVISYIEKPVPTEYSKAKGLADELSNYVKYDSYEDILDTSVEEEKQASEEENQEEDIKQKVEDTTEKEVEAPVEEKTDEVQESELTSIKVDSLPEEKTEEAPLAEKEQETEENKIDTPVQEKAVVTPIQSEPSKVEMPSFEELMARAKQAEQAEVTPLTSEVKEEVAPVAETPVAETPAVEAPATSMPEVDARIEKLKTLIITSKNDKIADTKKGKVEGIREVYKNKETVSQDKTLVKAA